MVLRHEDSSKKATNMIFKDAPYFVTVGSSNVMQLVILGKNAVTRARETT